MGYVKKWSRIRLDEVSYWEHFTAEDLDKFTEEVEEELDSFLKSDWGSAYFFGRPGYVSEIRKNGFVNVNPRGGFNSITPVEVIESESKPFRFLLPEDLSEYDDLPYGVISSDGVFYQCSKGEHGELLVKLRSQGKLEGAIYLGDFVEFEGVPTDSSLSTLKLLKLSDSQTTSLGDTEYFEKDLL